MLRITILFCLFSTAVFSQNASSKFNPNTTPDVGYSIHFEFKNHVSSSNDAELFKLIDFNALEVQRSEVSDVEIYLPQIDKTVILYSSSRTIARKEEIRILNNNTNNSDNE